MKAIWDGRSPAGHSEELLDVELDKMLFVRGQLGGPEPVEIPRRFEDIRNVRPATNEAAQRLQTVKPVVDVGRRESFVSL